MPRPESLDFLDFDGADAGRPSMGTPHRRCPASLSSNQTSESSDISDLDLASPDFDADQRHLLLSMAAAEAHAESGTGTIVGSEMDGRQPNHSSMSAATIYGLDDGAGQLDSIGMPEDFLLPAGHRLEGVRHRFLIICKATWMQTSNYTLFSTFEHPTVEFSTRVRLLWHQHLTSFSSPLSDLCHLGVLREPIEKQVNSENHRSRSKH